MLDIHALHMPPAQARVKVVATQGQGGMGEPVPVACGAHGDTREQPVPAAAQAGSAREGVP